MNPIKAFHTFVAILLFVSGVLRPERAGATSLHFLAIGDAGSGTQMQKDVAKAMADYAERVKTNSPVNFVLVLGDNFYEKGVTDVNDPQWNTKFESMYDAKLLPVPFIGVLGNHDWKTDSPDVEIAYARTNPRSRWQMDGHWYKRSFEISDGTNGAVQADFFLIDSALWELTDSHVANYADRKMGEEQMAWLREQLGGSTARWKFVIAHHPIFSNGNHGHDGDVLALRKRLLPLLNEYKVDAYITGHDHDLQRIEVPVAKTLFLVSGAAGKLRPQKFKEWGPFYRSQLGYLSIELSVTEMHGQFLDCAGKTLDEWRRAPRSVEGLNAHQDTHDRKKG